jgi:nucleoside-diphosphate-sugar epimerase
MPSVLIAGCGYVGEATARLFHVRGWEVEAWSRSARASETLPFATRAVDITDAASVKTQAQEFAVIIDCVSTGGGSVEDYRRVYLKGARNLLNAFPAARFIFTSSTSVYAQTDGACVDENSPADPQRATARILRETEELVLARGGIVARLAGIYGPGRSALLRKFLAGEATISGDGSRFINQVHREDIAAALFLLATPTVEPPRVFNVADDAPISERAAYEYLAAKFNRELPPTMTAAAPRKRSNSNKRVSNAKLRALGWRPQFPNFAAAMERSIIPALDTAGA